MRKEFTVKEAESLPLNEYGKEQLIAAQKLADDTSMFFPADAVVIVQEEDGKTFWERTEIRLYHPVIDLRISYESYKKKYSISCPTVGTFKNISNSHYITEDIERPNKMGVLNAAKIQQWVAYYEKVCKVLAALDKANEEKIKAFKLLLEPLPVRWNNEGSGGAIRRNGLVYIFSIQGGHISENIDLRQIEYSLQAFLALSDNKYKDKQTT